MLRIAIIIIGLIAFGIIGLIFGVCIADIQDELVNHKYFNL